MQPTMAPRVKTVIKPRVKSFIELKVGLVIKIGVEPATELETELATEPEAELADTEKLLVLIAFIIIINVNTSRLHNLIKTYSNKK